VILDDVLELLMTPAGPGVICRDSSPLTYLDHWAMRLFSTDDALAERLVAAIHASGGSLALSWLNVGEWATVTDRAQRLRIEELLNRLLPNLYCIEVEPFAVITREERGQFRAQADEALARLFVNDRERTVHPFTATGLFEPVNHPRLIAAKDRLAQTTLGQLENLRIEYMQNANFRREVKKGGTPGATDTLAVLRALVATYLPDPKRTLDTHSAIDFLHATVPASYCDAILLDGAGADAVNRARLKLSAGVKIAVAYSGRGDGVERFLAHLEAAAPAPTP
jgi:hypothetical protein